MQDGRADILKSFLFVTECCMYNVDMDKKEVENQPAEKRTGLARVISKMGYCSRSQAEKLVQAGRVKLNGQAASDPETPTFIKKDRIEIDGKIIQVVDKVYWMLHKPAGLVTTANDEKGRETIYSLLQQGLPWMGPVGRLDMDSEGLLLMTNDTEWAAKITAPESHLDKTYHVLIDRMAGDDLLQKISAGVEDAGDILKAKHAKILRTENENCWLEIILDEGKNRHIRRMMEACGIEVLRLIRTKIGALELGDLFKGQTRPLTDTERALLS